MEVRLGCEAPSPRQDVCTSEGQTRHQGAGRLDLTRSRFYRRLRSARRCTVRSSCSKVQPHRKDINIVKYGTPHPPLDAAATNSPSDRKAPIAPTSSARIVAVGTSAHDGPTKPSKHAHTPCSQSPLPLQSAAQTSSENSHVSRFSGGGGSD